MISTMITRACVAAMLALGCGGKLDVPNVDSAAPDASVSSDASDGAASACSVVDAGNCRTARHYLSCGNSICISDDDTCPMAGSAPCTDACDVGEYAAACGGGPIADESPPSSQCREMIAVPSGLVFYCCSCAD